MVPTFSMVYLCCDVSKDDLLVSTKKNVGWKNELFGVYVQKFRLMVDNEMK